MNKDEEKESKSSKDTIKKEKSLDNYEEVKWLTAC